VFSLLAVIFSPALVQPLHHLGDYPCAITLSGLLSAVNEGIISASPPAFQGLRWWAATWPLRLTRCLRAY